MTELVLAAALAVGGVADRLSLPDRMAYYADHFVETGVMEEDERDRFFRWEWCLDNDLAAMLDRESRVGPDTPPVIDRFRLPPPDQCRANYQLAAEYVRWLYKYLGVVGTDREWVVELIIADTKWRREWWLLASNLDWQSDGRRLTLEQLRTDVGRDAYYDGRWPDALPRVAYSHFWGTPYQEK